MGARLAAEALARGHRVTVVTGPIQEPLPAGVRVIRIESSDEMARVLYSRATGADIVIMAAAVCDFRPTRVLPGKLKRRRTMILRLRATPDIVGRLPRRRGQLVVGFALEAGRAVRAGLRKLQTKRLHLVLAQEIGRRRTPFGRQRVRAWLLTRGGDVETLGVRSKPEVARALLDKAETLWYGQHRLPNRPN